MGEPHENKFQSKKKNIIYSAFPKCIASRCLTFLVVIADDFDKITIIVIKLFFLLKSA